LAEILIIQASLTVAPVAEKALRRVMKGLEILACLGCRMK
jgi:hypothetical protein